jgi:hypothetical protein
MNGCSKRSPHGRFDAVGDDDATVRADTESTDLTRQPSGLAANSRTIDGSHTATLKHEWPHEKGGFREIGDDKSNRRER